MKISRFEIDGLLLLEPKIFGDERGFFMESYNKRTFEQAVGYPVDFVQDNHSRSGKNVLRGLHYQLGREQGKLVRVIQGSIFDVAVDIRPQSATFGRWAGVVLSDENKKQFWLPKGMAHGFLVLSDSADVLYKASGYYAPECERTLAWNDPAIAVKWPFEAYDPLLSAKDSQGLTWPQAQQELLKT